jgi:hypothetical protein
MVLQSANMAKLQMVVADSKQQTNYSLLCTALCVHHGHPAPC